MSGVALVTGSSGGIGKDVCSRLRHRGYQVIGLDIEPCEDTETILCDLSSDNFIQDLGVFDFGKVSLLVHCAAYQPASEMHLITDTQWTNAYRVNVLSIQALASFYLTDLATSAGTIICISSVHSRQTSPKLAAYAASKAALESWVRSASLEFGPRTAVIGLSLGAVDTPKLREGLMRWPSEKRNEITQRLISRTPIGRLGSSQDVASWVEFLASPAARFASGSVLEVNGGVTAWLGSE